ncbi:MAG TPA: TadE family protein [Acetobacteraceae bacterium]|nr:TadE family protein [Acetobacteraceae bacterium]
MRARAPIGGPFGERRCVAAMEFALVAPIMALMALGVYDLGRAFVVWEQLNDAAEAIAEAGEKLSITVMNGTPDTYLTQPQMQAAMSTIYAELPGLNWGNGSGSLTGSFAVTLSSVVYLQPNQLPCTSINNCQPQTPYVLWSDYFTESDSGQLNTTNQQTGPNAYTLWRACGSLLAVPQFPNNDTQLQYMATPTLPSNLPLIPQIVADVRYKFVPAFPMTGVLAPNGITLWASATLPAPIGNLAKAIKFDPSGGSPSDVEPTCKGMPGSPPL